MTRILEDLPITLAMVAILFVLCGCEASPRPNRPGNVEASVVSVPAHVDAKGNPVAERVEVRALGENDENPKEPMRIRVSPVGVEINTGGSAPFEWDAIADEPLFWIGGLLIVAGVGLLILSKYPIANLAIPSTAGWYAIAGGAGIVMLPYVGEGVREAVPVILIVGGLAGVLYLGWKLKLFERAVSPEVEADLLAEDDVRAAGAIRRVRTGSKAEAKMVAAQVEAKA